MTPLNSALLNEVKTIVQQGPSTINSLVEAAKKGKWTSSDTTQLVGLVQPLLQFLEGYNSVGILASAGASFGIGAEEVPGVVANTQDINATPYFYNFVAASFGFQEGLDGALGILIAQGTPSTLSGAQAFVDANVTIVAGVGVSFSADDQIMIFVSTGEDVSLALGAGWTYIKQL